VGDYIPAARRLEPDRAGAPPVNIWSVVPHRGLLLASDRDFGLYVLRHNRDDQRKELGPGATPGP
jgi:hypothetical protein